MNKISLHYDKIITCLIIIFFFWYNFNRINYGLPFFINLDENAFQYSSLRFLKFITGYETTIMEPIYAPLLNLILILNYVFINEYILNSLSLSQIESKIYFNPELFIYYGRLSSLTASTFSIIFLYLIFKKLKIDIYIYAIALITFSTSLALFDVSTINGKNSYYLLFFLVQIYFFSKYLLKLEKFTFKSYLYFAILGSIAWGINYWPAFLSFYAILILHFKKYKFNKLSYPFIFILVFLILGPFINIFFSGDNPFHHIFGTEKSANLFFFTFIENLIIKFFQCAKILFYAEKNFLLLLILFPIFFLNKKVKFKKEFLIVFFLILEPLLLFSISKDIVPQLRYFVGTACLVLILTSILINELTIVSSKKFKLLFIIFNIYIIYNNINTNLKINNVISTNNSFYLFNNQLEIDRSKILYLVDLRFQESIKQNLFYIDLFENGLIKQSSTQKKFSKLIYKKLDKIKNTENTPIINDKIKKNITYFNYSILEIKNFDNFFNHIKKNFEYIVIEESEPFYLSNHFVQNEIKDYVHKNFLLEQILFDEKKIFLTSQRSVIHYFSNTLNSYDFSENIIYPNLDKIYGSNYGLYKIK